MGRFLYISFCFTFFLLRCYLFPIEVTTGILFTRITINCDTHIETAGQKLTSRLCFRRTITGSEYSRIRVAKNIHLDRVGCMYAFSIYTVKRVIRGDITRQRF